MLYFWVNAKVNREFCFYAVYLYSVHSMPFFWLRVICFPLHKHLFMQFRVPQNLIKIHLSFVFQTIDSKLRSIKIFAFRLRNYIRLQCNWCNFFSIFALLLVQVHLGDFFKPLNVVHSIKKWNGAHWKRNNKKYNTEFIVSMIQGHHHHYSWAMISISLFHSLSLCIYNLSISGWNQACSPNIIIIYEIFHVCYIVYHVGVIVIAYEWLFSLCSLVLTKLRDVESILFTLICQAQVLVADWNDSDSLHYTFVCRTCIWFHTNYI